MSSPDCNTADVVGCVRQNPNLGFGIFTSTPVFIAFVWLLFLSYQGVLRFTGANGFGDFISFLYEGVTGSLSGYLPKREEITSGAQFQAGFLRDSWVNILLYLATLITVVSLGWYWRNEPFLGSVVLGLVLVSALLLFLIDIGGAVQIVGGIYMGLVIVGIVWLANFFSLEQGNEFGNTIMILIVVWIAITLFAYYGSKARKRKGRRIKTIVDQEPVDRKPKKNTRKDDTTPGKKRYPLVKWSNQFRVKYNRINVADTGNKATSQEIETAWRRALPLIKKEYQDTGFANLDDTTAFVYQK